MKSPFAHHLFGVSKRDCQLSSVRWRLESLSPPLCPAEVQPSVQCKGLQVTDKLNPKKTDPDAQESVAMSQVEFELSSISSEVLVTNFSTFQQFIFWAHLPILQYTTTLEPKKLAFSGALPLMTAKVKPSAFVAPRDGGHDRLMHWRPCCHCLSFRIRFCCCTLAKLIQVLCFWALRQQFVPVPNSMAGTTNTKCLSSVLWQPPPPWDVPRAQYLMNSSNEQNFQEWANMSKY